jgi:hypothetical protein
LCAADAWFLLTAVTACDLGSGVPLAPGESVAFGIDADIRPVHGRRIRDR